MRSYSQTERPSPGFQPQFGPAAKQQAEGRISLGSSQGRPDGVRLNTQRAAIDLRTHVGAAGRGLRSRTGSGFGVWGRAMNVAPFSISRSLVQSSQNHLPVPCILTAHALTRPILIAARGTPPRSGRCPWRSAAVKRRERVGECDAPSRRQLTARLMAAHPPTAV